MSLYVKIRQWFQPYWRPTPPELQKGYKQPNQQETPEETTDTSTVVGSYRRSYLKMSKVSMPLSDVLKTDKRPQANKIWWYHDSETHQILAHLLPNGRKKFGPEHRSDEERKALKPAIRPVNLKRPYDRTHLIPFGYVGTENDPRLVIGWNPVHNKQDLHDFEMRASKLDEPIYWFCQVKKTDYGAVFVYIIYSVNDGRMIDSLKLNWGTPQTPITFDWKEEVPKWTAS